MSKFLIRHLRKNETVSGDSISLDLKKNQKNSFKDWAFLNRMRPRKLIFDHFCGFGEKRRRWCPGILDSYFLTNQHTSILLAISRNAIKYGSPLAQKHHLWLYSVCLLRCRGSGREKMSFLALNIQNGVKSKNFEDFNF